MIGKKHQENKNIQPNSREMNKLKKEFPQFFSKDGEFLIDRFNDFLGQEEIEISKEGYELKFLGKSYAKYLSSLESETYISPDIEHNNKEINKNSKNLYIVGDNIDALKHLLSSYDGEIKCIYIDPPYNTGTDGFVYPDNFKFNAEELAETIGITEEESNRILELAGKSTHSAWLTFIYPRLLLARDLLSADGIIFISIGEDELFNLKQICDEIFGENNFISNLTRISKRTSNKGTFFKPTKDYILVYGKNSLDYEGKFGVEQYIDKSEYVYEDEYGKYKKNGASLYQPSLDSRPNQRYWIECPDGSFVIPPGNNFPDIIKDAEFIVPQSNEDKVWRWSYDRYLKDKNKLIFTKGSSRNPLIDNKGKQSKWNIYDKVYLKDKIGSKLLPEDVIYEHLNSKATKELKELDIPFDFPKPSSLVEFLLDIINTDKNSIILDFFSGSASTGHAVMKMNSEDNGTRKYILIQIPEKINKNKESYQKGYRTIDEIGRERIVRAGKKIKEETNADIDYGFKLFHLKKPSEKTLIDLEDFSPQLKLITDDMVSIFDNEHSTGKESILATWLNEDGYGLTKTTNKYKLNNYEADLIENTLYVIDQGLEDKDVISLIKDIENEKLDISRLVIYVHSLTFNVLQELRKNIKVLRNNKNVRLIERF